MDGRHAAERAEAEAEAKAKAKAKANVKAKAMAKAKAKAKARRAAAGEGAATPGTPGKRRVRRSPEEARALILDAADRVFAKTLPDVAGLKDVAGEAGVSHALVTHYFGTYEGLVEAALERRFHRLRDALLAAIVRLLAEDANVGALLAAHREQIRVAASEPATARLALWAALSGRVDASDFFPHRMQGLKLLADALEARSNARREDLELALVASFAMAVVWRAAGRAFAGALGKRPSRDLDAWFEAGTADMLDAFLDRSSRRRGA